MAGVQKTRELKGIHVLAIVGSAFAVIIAVNLTLAWKAVSTFPGLDVANSYVASQNFDQRRAAQEALGWRLDHHYAPGRFSLTITDADGAPVMVSGLSVLIGRTTVASADQQPDFTWNGRGYEAALSLAPGEWMMKVRAEARDGTLFERREDFTLEH